VAASTLSRSGLSLLKKCGRPSGRAGGTLYCPTTRCQASGRQRPLALCREADPDLPFVVVSGTIGEERAIEMMRAGAGDYLLKNNLARLPPVVERELREAVNRRARHQADQAASELAAIVESTDDAIISKTLDGVVTSWNRAAERLHGWTVKEAIGRHISFIVPPDKADELDQIMERLRRGERVEHFETGRVRKDGARIGVSITVSPIRDRHGRLTGISKISRDISGQQRLQRELRNRLRQQEVVAELGAACPLGRRPYASHAGCHPDGGGNAGYRVL